MLDSGRCRPGEVKLRHRKFGELCGLAAASRPEIRARFARQFLARKWRLSH